MNPSIDLIHHPGHSCGMRGHLQTYLNFICCHTLLLCADKQGGYRQMLLHAHGKVARLGKAKASMLASDVASGNDHTDI